MDRVILHSDINNCFANISCRDKPELRQFPVVVGGDEEARHGIVLAKNEEAKKYGIRTGETLWEARRKCPSLLLIPPDYRLYQQVSRQVRAIYLEYTGLCQPFGIDECWLDVSDCVRDINQGAKIAHEIRERVKREQGITVSVGVSFNKIFAKLGSDLRKPDAVTVISRDTFRGIVWPLPVGDLLYVGKSTEKKLARYGFATVGDIAQADPVFLRKVLGKYGPHLQRSALGGDREPVEPYGTIVPPKSVGNSMTMPRDLKEEEEVKKAFLYLAERVAARLRAQHLRGSVLAIQLRDNQMQTVDRQKRMQVPTNLSGELAQAAMELCQAQYQWKRPLRSVGISVSDLTQESEGLQLSFYWEQGKREKLQQLEQAVDGLRLRYGRGCVQRGIFLVRMPQADAKPAVEASAGLAAPSRGES